MPPGGNHKRKCPVAITETAIYFLSAVLLGEISKIMGGSFEVNGYKEKAEYIKAAFRKKFFAGDELLMKNRCQTSLATVLFTGLVDEKEKYIFLDALVEEIQKCEMHFDSGFQGVKFVLHMLLVNDKEDIGYEMLTKRDYPSFGYMIERGATTLWEDWEGNMSQNHPSFGDISTFLYQGLAGIRMNPKYPGYKKFVLKPTAPKGLDWVEAWHECPYGRIESTWRRNDGVLEYRCTVPANTEAELILFNGNRKTLKPGKYMFMVDNGEVDSP